MTKDRLSEIAFEMETPLNSLDCLDAMLDELINSAKTNRSSMLYVLIQRNLSPDLQELLKLWREYIALSLERMGKPPLKAVEE